jgi:hypothetical protein
MPFGGEKSYSIYIRQFTTAMQRQRGRQSTEVCVNGKRVGSKDGIEIKLTPNLRHHLGLLKK